MSILVTQFKKDRVEQELINKFNLPKYTPISKVSELFNYERNEK